MCCSAHSVLNDAISVVERVASEWLGNANVVICSNMLKICQHNGMMMLLLVMFDNPFSNNFVVVVFGCSRLSEISHYVVPFLRTTHFCPSSSFSSYFAVNKYHLHLLLLSLHLKVCLYD